MSFAELSSKFEAVDQHCAERQKGVQEFIHLLRERAMYEETYANGLDRVGNHAYSVTMQGSLARAVSAMKNHCLNKAMQARLLYESIKNDLAEPLQGLLKTQVASIKKPSTEGRKLTKDLELLRDKHNKAYSKYWKACKDCEDLTVLLEAQRDMPQDRRSKALSKLVTQKKEVDDCLRLYRSSIEAYNASKQHYDQLMPKVMEIYQRQEEVRLETMKDSLRKLVVYETACLRNLQYDIDNLAQAMENINVKSDLKAFVDEKAGQSARDEELVFVPYQGSHPAFQNLGQTAPIATIPHADASNSYVLNMQTAPTHIQEILDKAWLGLALDAKEISVYQAVAVYPAGRELWAEWMQKRVATGRLTLTEKGMEQVGALMGEVLTQCEGAGDFQIARPCIEAAAAIHIDEGIYLRNEVGKHSIWRLPGFWEKAIELSVAEERKEGSEIGPVVVGVLDAYVQQMQAFEADKELVKQVAGDVGRLYGLSTEELQPISARIGEEVTTVVRGVPQWLEEVPSPRKPVTPPEPSLPLESSELPQAQDLPSQDPPT